MRFYACILRQISVHTAACGLFVCPAPQSLKRFLPNKRIADMNDVKTPREPRPSLQNRDEHAPRRDAPARDGSRPDRPRSGRTDRHTGGADTAPSRFRRDDRRPASDGSARAPRRSDSLGPLRDVDEDILRLIVRRARLLARMPENASRERALRTPLGGACRPRSAAIRASSARCSPCCRKSTSQPKI